MSIQKSLTNTIKSASQSAEMVNRPFSMEKGIVTENRDPENKRRIKVTTAIMPGLDSYWLYRLKTSPGLDAMLPGIGSTVLILYEENNPLNGFYLPIENDVSAPQNKVNPELDYFLTVSGIIRILAANDIKVLFEGNQISITGNVKIDGNVSINGNLSINGNVSLQSSSVSINGSQVATVGSVDNRGDVLINRGW